MEMDEEQERKLAMEQNEILAKMIRQSGHHKISYEQIFYNEDGQIPQGLIDDYYAAARTIAERIVNGQTRGEEEGMAALFLFPHYIELALKSVIYHLGWLVTKGNNVPRAEWADWPETHDLALLWHTVEVQFPSKMGADLFDSFDVQFVEKCVTEFHGVDRNGQRLRYFEEKGKNKPVRDRLKMLAASWPALLNAIQHTHAVLEDMDTYVVESHGLNDEWENEMRSR